MSRFVGEKGEKQSKTNSRKFNTLEFGGGNRISKTRILMDFERFSVH
jgi:hypothetical protein